MLVLPCLIGLAVTAAPTSSDAPARLTRALAAETGGNESQALEQLAALVKAEPAWELPRLEAGRLLLKRGERLDEAEGWLDGARSLAPENARAHFLWAQLMEERGQLEKARHSLEVALVLRSDYDEARFRLAGLLAALGDFAGAAGLYREHLKAHPGLLGVKLQLATVLEKAGDLKAAEAELKSLLHGPQKDAATRRLIDFYNRHGRVKEAKHLAAASDSNPRNLRPLKPSAR